MNGKKPTVEADLQNLQRESFNYFLHETNPVNGLVIDKNEADWPASIAATGLALASYPVAVERGFMQRAATVISRSSSGSISSATLVLIRSA